MIQIYHYCGSFRVSVTQESLPPPQVVVDAADAKEALAAAEHALGLPHRPDQDWPRCPVCRKLAACRSPVPDLARRPELRLVHRWPPA